ncbi:hypothetical protein [Guptibacillus algicola]|uniref:hypothetical protein n=1 Tax=Guptibacillus algicola TaxID=225844 RepID=UPI001CD3423C|nr:hypothetical protein [Alkalihalobacillus algicola]MCA0985662.1 hypothetical protein [Alkalihalobacillus algicola]
MKTKTVVVWLGVATILTLALTAYYIFSLDNETKSTQGSFISTPEGEAIERDESLSAEELRELESKAVSSPEFGSVKEFISKIHEFYNDTAGYGGINNLNDTEQSQKAIEIILHSNYYIDREAENKDLVKDLKDIKKHALRYLEKPDVKHVKSLHRYFHDLDIALNQYKAYDRVWGVTELQGKKR